MSSSLRTQIRQQRKSLSLKERQHFAFCASLYLPKLLVHLPKHANIGLYLDGFGEMPVAPIFGFCQKYGFTPFLPITRANQALLFTPVYHRLDKIPVRHHPLGMREPFAKHVVTANRLDAILCPLVAVDRHGNRLGMGGGFYDRTFARSPRLLKVGFCYDFQVVEHLTVNPWDKKVDMVISDKGLLRF